MHYQVLLVKTASDVRRGDIQATEIRHYNLNVPKVMAKKLLATENEWFTMTETGGGILMMFNAGT